MPRILSRRHGRPHGRRVRGSGSRAGPSGHRNPGEGETNFAVGCRPSCGEEMEFASGFAPRSTPRTAATGWRACEAGVRSSLRSSEDVRRFRYAGIRGRCNRPNGPVSRAATSPRVRLLAPFDPLYGSYWIDGLRCVGTIQLYPLPAQLLPSSIAFEFADRKFVIDAWDKPIVNEWWWKWSDVYGKVNLSLDTTISNVVPMGPGFATKTWGVVSMASALLRSAGWGKEMSRLDYAGGFLRQWYKRLPLTARTPGPSDPLLHLRPPPLLARRTRGQRAESPLHEGDEGVGRIALRRRVRLLRPRSNAGLQRLGPPSPLVPSMVAADPELGARTQTPGVCGCLGWKLGEYLALGKAIISTPTSSGSSPPILSTAPTSISSTARRIPYGMPSSA